MRLKPDSADLPYNLGIALGRQGMLEEAAANYRQALRLKPDHAEAYHNLGVALTQQGQLADAAASYRAGPAASSRTMPRPTTISALSSGLRAGSRTRSPAYRTGLAAQARLCGGPR